MRSAAAFGVVLLLVASSPAAASEHGAHADLQALIDAAPPGTAVELDALVYDGGVVIDKPLTLDGKGVAVIDAGGSGHGIEVTSADVTIRDLTIRSTGDSLDRENAAVSATEAARLEIVGCTFVDVLFGVFARQSPDAVISGNLIGAKALDPGRRGDALRLWESPRSIVADNVVDGGRDSVVWFSDEVVVTGNQFTNGRYGLHFMYNSGAVVSNNRLEGNSVGAFMMYSDNVTFSHNLVAGNFGPSGYGLGLKEVDGLTGTGNHFLGNRIGIYLDNSPLTAGITQEFVENVIAFNDTGVLFTASVERNHFSRNAFVDNREQVGIAGSGVLEGNLWTIDGTGNYWSDFSGYDADNDGLGDVPYRLDDLYSTMTDRHPEVTFFADTPAARALDMLARIFPSLRPVPKVVDAAPLIDLPTIDLSVPGLRRRGPAGLITASLIMTAAAAAVALAARPRGGWA